MSEKISIQGETVSSPATPVEEFGTKEQQIQIPNNAELIIKTAPKKRKVVGYDGYARAPAHLQREPWNTAFRFSWPEDTNLGIESSIDRNKLPSQFEEIYDRFIKLGFIEQFGTHCVLMSSVLRRILRLHGYQAYTKQVVAYWNKEEKGQMATVGLPAYSGASAENTIDAHMIVYCQGYVLDFALKPLCDAFGATAPKALIGLDIKSDEYQDFGLMGNCAWIDVSPMHPIIKHWRYEQKVAEIDFTRQYFRKYQF